MDARFSQRRAILYGVTIGVTAISCFEQGKHSVRLYAARTRRAQPGTPQPPAGGVLKGKVKDVLQKKGQKGEVPLKKKTAILTARLTPAEKAAIECKAQRANMTVTDYIVKSALAKNVRQTDELAPILSELKAQGRNLNQLTKLANMGRITLVDAENFTEAYTNLYGLIEEIYWEGE